MTSQFCTSVCQTTVRNSCAMLCTPGVPGVHRYPCFVSPAALYQLTLFVHAHLELSRKRTLCTYHTGQAMTPCPVSLWTSLPLVLAPLATHCTNMHTRVTCAQVRPRRPAPGVSGHLCHPCRPFGSRVEGPAGSQRSCDGGGAPQRAQSQGAL